MIHDIVGQKYNKNGGVGSQPVPPFLYNNLSKFLIKATSISSIAVDPLNLFALLKRGITPEYHDLKHQQLG